MPIVRLTIRVVFVVTLVLLIGFAIDSYTETQFTESRREIPVATKLELKVSERREQRFERAAETLRADENNQSALEEVRRLAILEPAFLPAHRLMVNRLIRKNQIVAGSRALRKLRNHLEVLSDANDKPAQAMLAHVWVISKEPTKAIRLLRTVVRDRPDLSSLLSRLLILQGEKNEAKLVTQRAIAHYRGELEKTPNDKTAILSLAVNLGILERYTEAIQILRENVQRVPQLREPLMRYAMKEVDTVMKDDPPASLKLLQQAIADDPANVAIWSRVVRLSATDDNQLASQAESLLNQWAGKPSTEGKLELVRGAKAFAEEKIDAAIDYLEQAYEVAPESADILNNLASYLSYADPPQLERSITLADDLVARYPDRLEFRETRGQILALLKRNDDAILDLEKALTVMPTYQPLIDTLGSLYETAGNPAKAVALRETADRLRSQETRSQLPIDLSDLTEEILNWDQ